jgi:hypothetical protein
MNKQHKQRLNEVYIQYQKNKYPNKPERYLIPKYGKTDTTTNGLTSCIIDFLNYSGHEGKRQNTAGRYIDGTKKFTDVAGRINIIGTGKYIKSTSVKGQGDISAKIKLPNIAYPVAVEIEVKFGKDKMSEAQKEYELKMKNIGTPYIVVKTFADFIEWYDDFVKNI